MLPHDSASNDHDSGDPKENSDKNTEKGLDRSDRMADKKAGPDVGFDERNPSLCRNCRRVDFNLLFRAHDCSVSWRHRTMVKGVAHRPECRCVQEHISRTDRLGRPWLEHEYRGLLGSLDTYVPACSCCAFLYRCQVRLNLIPTSQEQWYCTVRPEFSLESIIPKTGSIFDPSYPLLDDIQDVAALQLSKKRGLGRKRGISQPILRVVDSDSKTLTRNKRAGGGLLARKLDPNKVNLDLIGEWLTLCRSTHSHCEDVDAGRIPGLLVIDCITGYIVPIPLEHNATNQVADYVTLSYLWGTAEATGGPVVQSINCDGGNGLALPTQIPLVISDTIRVVKQLGYRYLWVDRYCVPQEDAAAKHIQILNMGRIYSNSILTIIAAAGDGPEYGLPGVSSRSRLAQVGVQINDEISLVLYEPPTDHITNSKWNTRGWTYQEGLLSKRRLVFTDLMVYFQCQEMHGDEVLSLPIPGPGENVDETRPLSIKLLEFGRVFPKMADWGDPLTAWERISEYGLRELGYDSDALNAISGVMEMYALAAGDSVFKLFCGLPILPLCLWEKSWAITLIPGMWACSFRKWFENDAHAFEGASKAQRADDNNLTFSLAHSLCWRHNWGKSSELPASFEEARRELFGSWTAAGWRTRKSKPADIDHFDSCLRIRVQYSGELLLDWENENTSILELSRNGKMPLSLNITGLVMDVQMVWQEHRFDPDKDGWVITRPSTSEPSLLGSPRWLFEAVSGKGDGSKLIFLILGCYDALVSINQVYFVGMILRPVTRSSDGEARTFHEKLDSCSIEVSNDDWPRLASLTREMEVRLI